MIACIFHKGSGLGDQLFRYITCQTLALDKGYEFGVICPENFKGKDFMKLDMGKSVDVQTRTEMPSGKVICFYPDKNNVLNPHIKWNWFEEKTNYYDPEINFIEDNTIIDGNFQDERYWGHRLNEIKEWLKVEPLNMSDNVCVINFRGGEYSYVPDLFLTKDYWEKAYSLIENKYSNIKFEIHTDDIAMAGTIITGIPLIQDIALNWRSVRYAKHLIISNSAFGILPMLLNQNLKEAICPRYWARRNKGYWHLPQNYYKRNNIIYI